MSKLKKTPFTPLINKPSSNNTLNEKHVAIKGTNSFSREGNAQTPTSTTLNIEYKEVQNKYDPRLIPNKTAKMSPDVLLKINTLKPFIRESENLDRISINNIIDLLIENYVNTKLTVRQAEGYTGIYINLFKMLNK